MCVCVFVFMRERVKKTSEMICSLTQRTIQKHFEELMLNKPRGFLMNFLATNILFFLFFFFFAITYLRHVIHAQYCGRNKLINVIKLVLIDGFGLSRAFFSLLLCKDVTD